LQAALHVPKGINRRATPLQMCVVREEESLRRRRASARHVRHERVSRVTTWFERGVQNPSLVLKDGLGKVDVCCVVTCDSCKLTQATKIRSVYEAGCEKLKSQNKHCLTKIIDDKFSSESTLTSLIILKLNDVDDEWTHSR
jgi:hypothetical protein